MKGQLQLGKLADFVMVDGHPVYLMEGPGERAMSDYTNVVATGILRRHDQPEVPSTNVAVAAPPEHYYYLETPKVSVVY